MWTRSLKAGTNGGIVRRRSIIIPLQTYSYVFKRAHPRFHIPSAVLLLQAVLTSLLLLFGGSYQDLFSRLIFANFLFYFLNVIGLFEFRFREPDAQRPYRVWGYPVTPGLFVAAAGAMLYFSFVENLRNSLAGTAVILAGLPVYAIFARRRQLSPRDVATGHVAQTRPAVHPESQNNET
jgi:amino acid transporter